MMPLRAIDERPLDRLLAGVSRSFYLSLAVLPRAVRSQLSVAYLIARAADTIADTRVIRGGERLAMLGSLKAALTEPERVVPAVGEIRREILSREGGATAQERLLLERLGDCLRIYFEFGVDDGTRARNVLSTLMTGMERDLTRFPDGAPLHALASLTELDEHCYFAAGCVGEYWTLMTAAHVPSVSRLGRPDLVARGVRLGKALQMVNVIRDAPSDLSQGRCYWPRDLLSAHGVTPEELATLAPERMKPMLDALCKIALEHADAALPYVLAIPRTESRLRLAALWPLWIGLDTIALVRRTPFGQPAKISRQQVYRIMMESAAAVRSDRLLQRAYDAHRAKAQ